jgi:MFS family permease
MSGTTASFTFLPPGTEPDARRLLLARGLRAFGDGFVSLLLPYYLTLLGYGAFEIGIIVTATLLGSGALTLAVGLVAHRYRQPMLLAGAALLMTLTGCAFAAVTGFWPLLIVAVIGTINPSSGDASVFGPLEQSLLTRSVAAAHRTALFARYSLVGALIGALGAQSAAAPALLQQWLSVEPIIAVQGMFGLYGLLGVACFLLYRSLKPPPDAAAEPAAAPLGRSRKIVYTLAALFSLDAFASGLAVQSLLALWLFERFELSIVAASTIFFWTGILSAFSQLAAAPLARRIGLINSMVFTHLPSSVFLILVPFMPNLTLALMFLMLRSALSQMDVPARSSYVMAVVTPSERAAAASMTAVPRSLAAAASPAIAGWLLSASAFGWPLVMCGGIKIVYDLLLLYMFRLVRPPEEETDGANSTK